MNEKMPDNVHENESLLPQLSPPVERTLKTQGARRADHGGVEPADDDDDEPWW